MTFNAIESYKREIELYKIKRQSSRNLAESMFISKKIAHLEELIEYEEGKLND